MLRFLFSFTLSCTLFVNCQAAIENKHTFISAMSNHQKFSSNSLVTSPTWKQAERNYYSNINNKSANTGEGIPEIFHLVWLWGEAPENYKRVGEKIKELHPQADIRLWTMRDTLDHKFYNKNLWNSLSIYSDKQMCFAYELLYNYGGVYISPFMTISKPLNSILSSCTFFAGIDHNPEFTLGIDILASTAKHPVVKLCLDTFNQCRVPEFSFKNRIGIYENRDLFEHRYKRHLTEHYKQEVLSLYSNSRHTHLQGNEETLSLLTRSCAFPVNFFYPCPATLFRTANTSTLTLENLQKKYSKPYTFSINNPTSADALMHHYTYRPENKLINLPEQPCTVVVLTYNNQDYCINNINSILNQIYENFRVIIINDNSDDATEELIINFIKEHPRKNKVTYIKNKTRRNIMANHVSALALCNDSEIVVHVDGDDYLSSPYSLKRINAEYIKFPNTLVTYGSYCTLSSKSRGFSAPIPAHVLANNSIRKHKWVTSHIRTFRAWLFKQINQQDLKYKNKYVPCAADVTFMFPMIEMAGKNARYIDTVLGVYNDKTPQNVYKTALVTSQEIVAFMRNKKPYQPLKKIPNFI